MTALLLADAEASAGAIEPPQRPRPPRRPRRLVVVAIALLAAHALDDALLHRGPGVGAGQHLAILLVALAACAAALVLLRRVGSVARAALMAALGAPAIANGVMHLRHAADDRLAAVDVTGILALVAGAGLVGGAALTLWNGRRRPASPKRWAARAAGLPVGFVLLTMVVLPVGFGIGTVHEVRESVGSAPAGFTSVAFESDDDLRLRGWYRPSRSGAAVLIAHGGGSTRRGALRHGEMLARHGYGVLVYDSRGAGQSEGTHNSWGWDWEHDAAGALRFLRNRPDVREDRIAAMGLSSGADAVIALAADHPELCAVVADGAAARTYEDIRRQYGTDPSSVSPWLMFNVAHLAAGITPSRPLESLARSVRSPLLLVSTRREMEYDLSARYARAAPAAQHWNLPDASHTGAIRSHRAEYERRVTAFLTGALR